MSIFAVRPRIFTPTAEDFAQLPPALDTWSAWSDADDATHAIALPDLSGWRSFLLTRRDEVVDLAEGDDPGLVDGLIALAHDAHRRDLDEALADGLTPAEAAAELPDAVIWSDGSVVAVLRALPSGALEVLHLPEQGFLDPIGGGRC